MLDRNRFLIAGAAALISLNPREIAAKSHRHRKTQSGAASSGPEQLNPGSQVNVAEFSAAPQAIDPALLAGIAVGWHAPETLPSAFTLPDLLPVTQQGTVPKPLGSPGSCEAQSFGHGLSGYTASRTYNGSKRWDQTDPANLPSAAWLYSYAHYVKTNHCPSGSGAIVYLQQMVRAGSPSQKSVPYTTVCATIDPLYKTPVTSYPEAAGLRVGSFATFQIPKVTVEFIKGYLAAGHAIAFSGPVASGYSAPALSNGVWTAQGAKWNGGHGQVIVGYDDDRGGKGVGAFLVQNSFGSQWGQSGRLWWAYDVMMKHQKLGAVAFPRAVTLSGTALKATGSGAPHGTIAAAKAVTGGVLIALQFSETVEVTSIAVGSKSLSYNAPLAAGIVHVPGSASGPLTIKGQTLAGTAVTYSGTVKVA